MRTPILLELAPLILLLACGDKSEDSGVGTCDSGLEDGCSGDEGGGEDGGGGEEGGGEEGDGTGDDGGTDSGDGCDDPFPAVCATGVSLESDPMMPATLEAWSTEGELVEATTCGETECCSYTLPAGTYTFVGTLGEAHRPSQEATVENSFACDHEVTHMVFEFDVAR